MGMRNGGWQQLRGEDSFTTGFLETTGDITSGSAVITNIPSTAGLSTDYSVSGDGVDRNARIASVDSATQVTMTIAATDTTVGLTLRFGQDAYALPEDLAYFTQLTYWDRSYRWQLLGPLSPQEWQVLKSGLSPIGPRKMFRIFGNRFYLHPVPGASDENIAYEYYSNAWCQTAAGVAKATWSADTDYYSLDDDAFVMGLKWRFKAAKGLDYSQEKLDYDAICQRLMSRNAGNRALPLNAQYPTVRLLNNNNIPDTGFGQ